MKLGPDELCGNNASETRAFAIKPFVQEVMSYGFQDAPNYSKLRFLLEKALLDRDLIPIEKYDFWAMERYKSRNMAASNQIDDNGPRDQILIMNR